MWQLLSKSFTVVALLALLWLTTAGAQAQEDKPTMAVVGQAAPALVATTLDGKPFDLSSLKGKVVVIHLWATWCGPCRDEMPALEAVWRHYRGKGLEVLAISADRPRARGDVDQVMHMFTFPAAMLSALTKNDFGQPSSIPVTYIIDKGGKVSYILTPDIAPLREQPLGDTVKNLLDAKLDDKADAKTDAKNDTKMDVKSDMKPEPKP